MKIVQSQPNSTAQVYALLAKLRRPDLERRDKKLTQRELKNITRNAIQENIQLKRPEMAVHLAHELGEHELGATALKQNGYLFESTELMRRGGQLHKGVRTLIEAGQPEKAARLYFNAGKDAQGLTLLQKTADAELARRITPTTDKAEHWLRLGRPDIATMLYASASRYEEGAKALLKHSPDDSMALYALTKKPFEGGEAMLRAGHPHKAAYLFERSGQLAAGAAKLQGQGHNVLAGLMYQKAGLHREAGKAYAAEGLHAAAQKTFRQAKEERKTQEPPRNQHQRAA